MAKKHTDEWQEPEAAHEQPRVADILSGPEQVGGYPRLLWAPDGTEITVYDKATHAAKVAEGHKEEP